MKKSLLAVLAALLVAAALPLTAHHSFGAEYDADKPITLAGTITKIEWTNPHSHIYVDVKGADGKVRNWKIEGYPPVVLSRTGWKRDVTMKVGDAIALTGWQARDGGDWGHGRQITFADGNKLFFGPPAGTGDGGARPVVGE
jgi:hypothetical protein